MLRHDTKMRHSVRAAQLCFGIGLRVPARLLGITSRVL